MQPTTGQANSEIIKIEWDGEITEGVENKKYAWRTIGGPFTGFGSMIIPPIDSGARYTMDYEIPHSFLGKLLDKLLIQEALESEFDEGLNEIKAMLKKKTNLILSTCVKKYPLKVE